MALDETRRTLLYATSSALSIALDLTYRAVMNQPQIKHPLYYWEFYEQLQKVAHALHEIIAHEREEDEKPAPKPKVLGAFDQFLSNCVNESINGGSER